MPIFKIKNNKAQQIVLNSAHFRSEQELHDFFEKNIEILLGVRLLRHKYDTQGFGIPDTLALDETNSPVIIEYKLGQDPAVLVQGFAYFSWLKTNRRHFELLVKDKIGKNIRINWDNPRVILIAQGFDGRTMLAVREMNNVELIKYVPYGQNILYLETVYGSNGNNRETNLRTRRRNEETHDLDYHLNRSTKEVREIFHALQEKIKLLPGANEIIDQITGITYRATKSFAFFQFGKSYIDIELKEPRYNDPKNLVRDISHFGIGYN